MSVVLAMMAKAPADVVLRAIQSALHLIDSVCLVVAPGDPLMSLELPIAGRIVEEPWVAYDVNRTRTLHHAESDPLVQWVMMFDAYSTIRGRALPPLMDADAYEIAVESKYPGGAWRWLRPWHLMRARRGFTFRGTGSTGRHEALVVPEGAVLKPWPYLVLDTAASPKDGTGRTYMRDAVAFCVSLRQNPNDTRAAFYYAQSLKDAGDTWAAYEAFERRAAMRGGLDEETFWALLWAARLAIALNRPDFDIRDRFVDAHKFAPHRAEPLADLAWFYRVRGDHELAYRYDLEASQKPYPTHARLFVDLRAYSAEALAAAGIEA